MRSVLQIYIVNNKRRKRRKRRKKIGIRSLRIREKEIKRKEKEGERRIVFVSRQREKIKTFKRTLLTKQLCVEKNVKSTSRRSFFVLFFNTCLQICTIKNKSIKVRLIERLKGKTTIDISFPLNRIITLLSLWFRYFVLIKCEKSCRQTSPVRFDRN